MIMTRENWILIQSFNVHQVEKNLNFLALFLQNLGTVKFLSIHWKQDQSYFDPTPAANREARIAIHQEFIPNSSQSYYKVIHKAM